MKVRLVSVLSIVILMCSCEKAEQIKTIVSTVNGAIKGAFQNESGVFVFKGIPFAAPPVGNLRWKAPQPVANWSDTLDCTRFSASAMQATPLPFMMWTFEFMAPVEPLSEDCLYLNVWTAAKKTDEKRPVIVYIHGGGFNGGSGACPIYDGSEMARKGVVFVTINYRLGIFGFFSHPELTNEAPYKSSGNYGLLDQIEALKWVKTNIAAFGGNPNNVTIAGQSAGAFSVCYLTASPLAKGLFQKAIAESGGAVLPTGRLSQKIDLKLAEQNGLEVAKTLEVSSIEDLRKVPAEELLKVKTFTGPIVDGYVILDNVSSIYAEGKQNDVPLLTGWNDREGLYFFEPARADKYIENAKSNYGEFAADYLKLFPADNDSVAKQSQYELSDLQGFGVQAFTWMDIQNKTGKSNVYMYYFNREVPFGEGQKPYGAFHSGEIFYAYNTLGSSKIRPWTKIDYKLAEVISSYWVNFAKNGDPNEPGLPEWQPCKSETYSTMYLGDSLKLKTIPKLEKLQFLERYFETDANKN